MVTNTDAAKCDDFLVVGLGERLALLQVHGQLGVDGTGEGQIKAVHAMSEGSDAVCGCCDTGWRTRAGRWHARLVALQANGQRLGGQYGFHGRLRLVAKGA